MGGGVNSIDQTEAIKIAKELDETTLISMEINCKDYNDLKSLSRRYIIFQIPGVDPDIACHKLDVNPNIKPIK